MRATEQPRAHVALAVQWFAGRRTSFGGDLFLDPQNAVARRTALGSFGMPVHIPSYVMKEGVYLRIRAAEIGRTQACVQGFEAAQQLVHLRWPV